jgi:hypothetical protein
MDEAMRMLCLALVIGCAEPPSETTAALAGATYASLASVDGTITTLAKYSDGGTHPGVNAIDIAAPGGTAVFHQLDYLKPEIAGGWIYIAPVHEAGRCSQWWPGSPYYNGAKIVAHTYFYDTWGNFAGSHRAVFQHVDPHDPHMFTWLPWSNANGTSGGVYVGTVHPVGAPIYNGPSGALCTSGSHVHQEGDGSRAGQRFVGEHVTGRYSDLHYFTPAWSKPVGEPPSGDCGSAHAVVGAIRARWEAFGGCAWGAPEIPESDACCGGRYQTFTNGAAIYWTEALGAHEVHGAIRDHWAATGWEWGWLGFPITDEYQYDGTPYGMPGWVAESEFERGWVSYAFDTGEVFEWVKESARAAASSASAPRRARR